MYIEQCKSCKTESYLEFFKATSPKISIWIFYIVGVRMQKHCKIVFNLLLREEQYGLLCILIQSGYPKQVGNLQIFFNTNR